MFSVNRNLVRKVLNNDTEINSIVTVSNSELDRAKKLDLSERIIPSFTYNGSTITGGHLCHVGKSGRMYFYNQGSGILFKSDDDGASYQVLFSNVTNPGMFLILNSFDNRPFVTELDNGEILFQSRQRTGTAEVDKKTFYTLWRTSANQTVAHKCFMFSNQSYLKSGVHQYSTGCQLSNWTCDHRGAMIFVTEYGEGNPQYWDSQGQVKNGNGVSGRVWVSLDYGITWKKIFDADRKKSGTDATNLNWYYFRSTQARMYCHMHTIHIDRIRNRVWLACGDNYTQMWNLSLNDVTFWYSTAPSVNPEEFPVYSTADTFPDWTAADHRPLTDGNVPFFLSSSHIQVVRIYSIGTMLILGHDQPREFAMGLMDNENMFTSTPTIDLTYRFENRNDYASQEDFENAFKTTDGFVQDIFRENESKPIHLVHTGPVRRIYATYDNINFLTVLEDRNSRIGFGTKLLDHNGKKYMSTYIGEQSNVGGFYRVTEVN